MTGINSILATGVPKLRSFRYHDPVTERIYRILFCPLFALVTAVRAPKFPSMNLIKQLAKVYFDS